jgi:hypothetical protein
VEVVMPWINPRYRFRLKGKIHEAGFRTMAEYAEAANVDASKVSRVVGGWEFPSKLLAERLRRPLDVTLDEFCNLIEAGESIK